jgi:Fe-S-cluster-containing dehydrogenase component
MFGDLNDPESNVSKALREHPTYQLRDNLGTGPRVYYIPAVASKEA